MTIDSSRKENLTPAGIQTTTLKEIEKKDPFQKQVHDADLFDNSKKPADRFLDIPKYVPFAFAVGGVWEIFPFLRRSGLFCLRLNVFSLAAQS